MSNKDEVVAKEKWEFDKEVAECFDDMLRRSIPQYDVMRSAVFTIGSRFVSSGTDVVDLGCSRGDALAPFIDHLGAANRFVGVEVSRPMLSVASERFSGLMKTGVVKLVDTDLRYDFPTVYASLILSVLTLQFIPIEYRQNIVQRVYDSLAPGGAFILVEKVLGNTSFLDSLFVEEYLDTKRKNGYTDEQINRKRASLEGVLVPITTRWNEQLLYDAGFNYVDCFWRWMNFAAFVAVKKNATRIL